VLTPAASPLSTSPSLFTGLGRHYANRHIGLVVAVVVGPFDHRPSALEQVAPVAELAGEWSEIGKLSLDSPCCVVLDPKMPIPDQALELLRSSPTEDTDLCTATGYILGALLSTPVGSYLVEIFRTEDDTLGVRLRVQPA